MKKLILTALTLTAAFALIADTYTPSDIPTGLSASDVTPGEINYQGFLRNPKNGDLYDDGIYTLECRLYKQESGGTPIWGVSYTAYVKDGYFNLMLGGTGGADLNYTFKATELWKALWFKTGSRDLYLGVTPCQGPNNNPLSAGDKKEISPRQKLLTAPFAFRAQKAQYADAAPGNFKVAGNLDVSGNVNIASGKSLTLKNITASDSEVKLGNNKSSPSKATLQGATVTVEAGTALNVNSHGNATVTMDSGKTLKVNGGVLRTTVTTADIGATLSLNMHSDHDVTLTGSEVDITAEHGLGLNDGKEDGLIVGGGSLQWTGRSSKLRVTPTYVAVVTLTFPAGYTYVRSEVASLVESSFKKYVPDYKWMIAGYTSTTATVKDIWVDQNNEYGSMAPYVNVRVTGSTTSSRTVTVHLLGVINNWIIDTRR